MLRGESDSPRPHRNTNPASRRVLWSQPFDYAQGQITLKRYLTASFKVFEARNLGTRIALIWIVSPVLGLRPVLAARVLPSKMPNPATETSSPFFRCSVIAAIIASTARSASAFVHPIVV